MEWKLRRGDQEYGCPTIALLKQWAMEGRIQPEDYVFNPVLQQWIYARDAAELQPCFNRKERSAEAGRYNALGLGFGIPGILLCMVPFLAPLGALLLLVGIVFTVIHYAKRA